MQARPTPEQSETPSRDGGVLPPDAGSAIGTAAYRPILAVMLLGVGAVMVATVIPGGVNVSGEALRTRVAGALVETAVETLKLTVPALQPGLDGNPADTNAKVLFPKALVSQFDLSFVAVELDASIESGGEADLYRASPYPVPGAGWVTAPQPPAEWVPLSRTFTEASFWDAEIVLRAGAVPDLVTANTWVAPLQNMLVDSKSVVADRPPYIDLLVGSLQAPPRVHLLDRVYPPGALRYNYARDVYCELNPQDPRAVPRILTPVETFQRIVRQRYAWHVIHGLSPLYEQSGSFLCTIAVTHRDDLDARYARQADPVNGDLRFDLSDPDGPDVQALRVPVTAGAAFDTVFPQAWLVVLDEVVPETGTVACTRAVARMLPVGSYFIIARTGTAGVPAGFATATPHKVIGSSYGPGPGAPSTAVTLRIARSSGGPMGRTAVWVFPPPIRDHDGAAGPRFKSRSPVVGVFIREIATK